MRISSHLVLALCALLAACGKTNKSSDAGGASNTLAMGVCADTCAKPCDKDDDCRTSEGELCCDYGGGKACSDARACPRQCEADARCETTQGEACVRVTLDTKTKVCSDAADGLKLCPGGDTDCKTKGEVCCGTYREPVCLPANSCPAACDSASKDKCGTAPGQVCCTTLARADQTLKSGAICIDTSQTACPHACESSLDCATKQGELCCGGLCSTSCPHACSTSSDCDNQVCCKTRAVNAPLYSDRVRRPGYTSTPTVACSGFRCNDGTCLNTSSRCDGNIDCRGGEDEGLCPPSACTGFRCASGSCLSASARCNGVSECPAGDDEAGCPSLACVGFQCTSSSLCLQPSSRCNGLRNCPSGEDELDCPTCSGFLCNNLMCILSAFKCDGHADCPGGEDEGMSVCGCFGGFQCSNLVCIPASAKCDGKSDCSDGGDELGCTMTCPEFTCSGGRCIFNSWRCDGFPDCPMADDEANCGDAGQ